MRTAAPGPTRRGATRGATTASRWRGTSGASPSRRAGTSRSSCAASTGRARAGGGRSSAWPRIPAASSAGRGCRTREADAAGYGVRAGAAFSAGPDHVRLDLGPDCRVEAELAAPIAWPRRAFGGLGGAHAVPGLSQYWHPHLFAADVRGRVVAGAESFSLDGAGAYAEKNWGGGFPDRWWWGQAHDFGDRVSVAFAGGPVGLGRGAHAGDRRGRAAERARCCAAARRPPSSSATARGDCAPAPARTGSRSRAPPIRPPRTRSPCRCRPSAGRSTAPTTTSPARCACASTRRGRTVFAGESALAGLERGGA